MSLLAGAAARVFKLDQVPQSSFLFLIRPTQGLQSLLTYLQRDIREVIKVACVIDGPDLDGDGGGPLPDVLPVHAPEPGPALNVLKTLDPILALSTKPAEKILALSRD